MDKKYLNKRGLATLLGLIKFGHKKIWHGTQDEWDALSAEEKDKYDQAEIEDQNGIAAVDKIEDGNMNPVTSNAVAEALSSVGAFIHCGLPLYELNDESATVMSTVNVPKGTWLLVGVVMNTVTSEFGRIALAVTGDGASLNTGVVRSVTGGYQSQTIIGVAKFTSDTNKVGITFVSVTGNSNGDDLYWYVNAIKIAE